MIDRTHALPVSQQARLVGIAKSSAYYRPRLASEADQLLLRRQREVDLDVERLAVEIVDHVEQLDDASIDQLVVHGIHRPDLVDDSGHRRRLRNLLDQPLAWLGP